MMSGPNIEPSIDNRPVSQAGIAPTVLGYLGLDVSNHYMGVNLLDDSLDTRPLPAVYSFKFGSMALRQDSMSFYLVPVDGTEPATAQKIKLEPQWNTDDPADGFVTGTPVEMPADSLQEIARKMRAAAKAWEHLVFQNKIMPMK